MFTKPNVDQATLPKHVGSVAGEFVGGRAEVHQMTQVQRGKVTMGTTTSYTTSVGIANILEYGASLACEPVCVEEVTSLEVKATTEQLDCVL